MRRDVNGSARLLSDTGFLQVKVIVDENGDYPSFSDISYFLQDLNLLYEYLRMREDARYEGFRFDRFFVYRNRRRIDPRDRLIVQSLTKESPLTIMAVVVAVPSAAATIWALAQFVEMVYNAPLKRRILKLTEQELRQKVANLPEPSEEAPHRALAPSQSRRAAATSENIPRSTNPYAFRRPSSGISAQIQSVLTASTLSICANF